MTTALGITTYNRPYFLLESLGGAVEHLLDTGAVDRIFIYNDGSTEDYEVVDEFISEAKNTSQITIHHATQNFGVATAKNWLVEAMLDDGHKFLFLGEDDVVPNSDRAIGSYLDAHKWYKQFNHLMYAHHGPANQNVHAGSTVKITPRVQIWPNCVGAWCFYTAKVFKEVGMFDTAFLNAMEHVEHTHRIILAGLAGTPKDSWNAFPDVVGSKSLLTDIDPDLTHSVIRQGSESWALNFRNALIYWSRKDPEHFPLGYLLDRVMQ